MTAKDLANINTEVRKMITQTMEKKNLTLNGFAKAAGVHQNQLWLYLYSDTNKGLHSSTLEKIGKFLST
jgi:hypothetical protein